MSAHEFPEKPAGATLGAALALGLSVAIGHGIGRFSYALIMPAMKANLHWTYEQASWMNTSNALGYIGGTAAGLGLIRRCRPPALFRVGLLMTALSLVLMTLPLGFAWFVFLRVLSGVGTAWTFSIGGAFVNAIYASNPATKGPATGLFFGSAGLGMMATAAVAPYAFDKQGLQSWPLVWAILGGLSLAAAIFPLRASRVEVPMTSTHGGAGSLEISANFLTLLAYLTFAASQTGYVFFVFAWVRAQHLAWYHGAGMWMLLGLGVLLSAAIWRKALGHWRASNSLALCSALCAVGAALPITAPSLLTVYGSALVVGTTLFIAPAAMAVLARQSLPAHLQGKALMLFAMVFAIGQAAGSWGFGVIADRSELARVLGVASAGLFASAALAFVGARRARP